MKQDAWLSRLLGLWLASFGGLLAFLYALVIGTSIDGRSMLALMFK